MTSREQIDIEISAFENELAKISAEDLEPVVRTLVDSISKNLAVIQENREDLTWLDIRAWIANVRFAIFAMHGQMNVSKMLGLGMTL